MIPFLYIFVPANFLKKLCDKRHYSLQYDDENSDETFDEDTHPDQFRKTSAKKKKDSFLGDLERTEGASSDDGEDQQPK